MEIERKQALIHTATKQRPADLVIKNATIVNVFTKQLQKGDIAITLGHFAGIGEYEGVQTIDAAERIVCPGLIDSHVHIESAMVTPDAFAQAVLPYGTVAAIADPHEIVNVCGADGLRYMLDQTQELPLDVFFMLPSCVPAGKNEHNGAVFSHEDMIPYVDHPRIVGLGEVMDLDALLAGAPALLSKIRLFDDKVVDGHAPLVTGENLQAIASAGIMTDHECSTGEEAVERVRSGLYVQVRQGSAAKNTTSLIQALLANHTGFERVLFCSDDKQTEDIRRHGHINENIRKAVACGLDPISAIACASLHPAVCYGLKRRGAIAPGYLADFVFLDDLTNFTVKNVYKAGIKVCENGRFIGSITKKSPSREVLHTVRIPEVSKGDLVLNISKNPVCTVRVVPDTLITEKNRSTVKTESGKFIADERHSKAVVVQRHSGKKQLGLGIVKNFCIRGAAMASTVSHDSHNLIVIGDNDRDILCAIDTLRQTGGGYVLVQNGQATHQLDLPIAGLMSDRPPQDVEKTIKAMLEAAYACNVNPKIDPLTVLSFLALTVIPHIRITDSGVYDVDQGRFL